MGKIATEQEAYNIGKSGIPTSNKCCTKTRAEELGCKVSGVYESNQLVQLVHLSTNVKTHNILFKPGELTLINRLDKRFEFYVSVSIQISNDYSNKISLIDIKHYADVGYSYIQTQQITTNAKNVPLDENTGVQYYNVNIYSNCMKMGISCYLKGETHSLTICNSTIGAGESTKLLYPSEYQLLDDSYTVTGSLQITSSDV